MTSLDQQEFGKCGVKVEFIDNIDKPGSKKLVGFRGAAARLNVLRHLTLERLLPAARAQRVRELWDSFVDAYDLANSPKPLTETELYKV
jgi:hypothetical protein